MGAPINPNAWLWRSKIVPKVGDLLAPMPFTSMYAIWNQARANYKLSSPKSLLTSFLDTPTPPDSLTFHMVNPWRIHGLMPFDQIVHPLTLRLKALLCLAGMLCFATLFQLSANTPPGKLVVQ